MDSDCEHERGKKGAVGVTLGTRHKQLSPMASIHVVAVEVSMSMSKHSKPSPAKISAPTAVSGKSKPQPHAKVKPKLSASKEKVKAHTHDSEDMGKEDNRSMVIDVPITSIRGGCPRQSAANKAITWLREVMLEQKQVKWRWSEGGEPIVSIREEEGGEEKGGKMEVEVNVVLVSLVKAKPTDHWQGQDKRDNHCRL